LVEGASWRRTEGQPENKTFDESRRLGLKAGLEGWHAAQAAGKPKAEPESGIEGASWRSTRRWAGKSIEGASWRLARRRSPEQQAAQVAGRFEGRAGRLADGASWKLTGKHSRKVDRRRKL